MRQTPGLTLLRRGKHRVRSKQDSNARLSFCPSLNPNPCYSFFLTPLNYFDHDVSLDSINAILLQTPSQPGEPFFVEDYGVRPVHCVPKAPAPFEYAPVRVFDQRGEEVAFESVEAMRGGSELYHRIKFDSEL